MITLRPWKGSKNEFEVDVRVENAVGRKLRQRVKAPVTGRSAAERWAKALEQELLAQLLAPEPEPEKPPPPMFEEFAKTFLDLCQADRLGTNTLMNYDGYLRLYLLPVLARRRLDEVTPKDITAIKKSLVSKSHNTMCEVLKTLRRVFNRAIAENEIKSAPVDFEIPRRKRKPAVAYDDQEQVALLAAAQAMGPMFVVAVLLGLDGGPFVLDNQGSHFQEHHIKSWMKALVKRAGLPWHGTHVLRKSCGTRIAEGGGGVAAVASHLRHKDLQTASDYVDRRRGSSSAIHALETSGRRTSEHS
ncbi:tyrosine-type recombinase/integrase [Nannocystis sp. RBIL2]|uniref:tyrosine-type recombinase/integrase n=1 Tax=Nannocystis sp. RBIL2 TaxID=2996788 RepID=UPI0022703A4C|nr:tyrosine-type recombinase/integrase [Nannocystis sp. RBIL2]MCY1072575.1 tyrosine-type recombinase/integrase [Nannocystis sp. RBIL2]